MYDLHRLRALHAIRLEGSVAAAADRLGFTPSAVSQQIGKLEVEAGAPLLEKAGRGVVLTDAGIILCKAAESILQTTEEANAGLEELRAGLAGDLRILSFATAIRGLLGPAMDALREKAPDLRIQVEETDDRVLERVEGGHADLTITHDWVDATRAIPDSTVRTVLLEDPVDVVLPATHPCADRTSIAFESLLDEHWITDPSRESVCSLWLRNALAARGAPLRVGHRVEEFPSQIALITSSDGVSLMPRLGRPELPDSVRAIPLRGDQPVRRIFSVCRRSSSRRPAIRTLTAALKEAARA